MLDKIRKMTGDRVRSSIDNRFSHLRGRLKAGIEAVAQCAKAAEGPKDVDVVDKVATRAVRVGG